MECTICRLSRDLHAIILFYLRETPYRDDTADDMALCISSIVLGMTGLRSMACVRSQRKHNYISTS